MCGRAARIELTTTMYEILCDLMNSRNVSVATQTRAGIILFGFAALDNSVIATLVDHSTKTVGLWRRRWQMSYQALLRMQFAERKATFRRAIIECLKDAPRSGSPGTFTAEQIFEVISIACEPPAKSNRPVTTWTGWEIADEACPRGICTSISAYLFKSPFNC